MTFEELKAQALQIGRECGEVTGDQLAAALAFDLSSLEPVLADAWRLEVLFDAYSRIKAMEAALLSDGVDREITDTFRISAAVSLLVRLKLGDLSAAAAGRPN